MQTRRRALLILAALSLLTLISLLLALSLGNVPLGLREALAALFGRGEGMAVEVVRSLRLPRALAGLACGGLLAVSGALLQVLLRNPLADPYVLGISGGASVGALLVMLLGLTGGIGVGAAAFCGALAAMFMVFGLAHGNGGWTQTRLLLTGVIVAAGCGAAVALMLSIAPDYKLHGMLFWLMGDLSQAGNPAPGLGALALIVLVTLPFARELNLLARNADLAQTLGVEIGRLRLAVYVIASLATATAVTQVGSVGFIGLIVPHLTRLAVGNDQRILLPEIGRAHV